ncbi:DUF3828 domain-containing protein [Phreatobacter sp.]|uniref:DUF3828 domain-containing protein n=1 Tax=Phreatobacter sp. TaxID=1966341 RepID=UPI003F70B526
MTGPSRRVMVAGLAVQAWLVPATPRAQSADDPVATVRGLYGRQQGTSDQPFLSARLKRLFDEQIARSRQADEVMPGLDFDYACGCQDYDEGFRTTLRLTAGTRDAASAEVVATFRLFDQDSEIRFDLTYENGRWLIDDARRTGTDGWTLSHLLQMQN